MAKVFISHSSRDKKFVRKLKDDLYENNIDVWLDEDQLDIGDSLIEKLELSLEESTHFLIILSPHSVNSDWVKFELSGAIKQVSKRLMSKIMPVKYRECEIPKDIEGLLYYDLSNEVVEVVDDKVKFTTNGFPAFLTKLIKTIKSSSTGKLSSADKLKLQEELKETEKGNLTNRDLIATLMLQVVVFSTLETRTQFMQKIIDKSPLELSTEIKIRPILLPRVLKNVFKNIELGHEFTMESEFANGHTKAHFAGFRRDDLKLTIPSHVRKDLNITNGPSYLIRFDGNSNTITILKEE